MCDGGCRAGAVGWLDTEGWLRITDRLKEMIKVRGFQVAPAEIEAVLHGHPAVKDCAGFGVPGGITGEAVVAASLCRPRVDGAGRPPPPPGGEQKLASSKRPSRVVFVDDIPRLP